VAGGGFWPLGGANAARDRAMMRSMEGFETLSTVSGLISFFQWSGRVRKQL